MISIKTPKNVEYILNKIASTGNEAVIIGGCVRDSIMGLTPHDWDIATSAQPNEVIEIFNDHKVLPTGLKHGTVTVIIDHEPYEITTYRIDGKYTDHRRPDSVSFTTDLAQDIMRRDFTINAIAYDGKNIIDFHNGVEDIKSGIIRCVGNADDRFQEDPLRILRAVRFSARFGFVIDDMTKVAMFDNAHLLSKIAIERKQSEFTKAVCASNISYLVEYADILNYVMPGISGIDNWNEVLLYVSRTEDLCEKLAFILDSLNIKEYNDIVELLFKIMRYPNNITKSVCNIMECKKELITDSTIGIRLLLSKYPKEDVIKTFNYKIAKINESDEKEKIIACKLFTQKVYSQKDFCYDLKNLQINGYDLKAAGIPDVEIKTYLLKLLHMVITGQVKNNNESLIQVVKNSML